MRTYIGTNYTPVTIKPSIGRSDFQTAYIKNIAADPDTDYLCNSGMCDTSYSGSFVLTFVKRDGTIHSHLVGVSKLIDAWKINQDSANLAE
jgi:hypothetical protein